MSNRRQLLKLLCRTAGGPDVERIADDLTAAGILTACDDLLPEDAATLLVAIATAPSPDDAADAVRAYNNSPLTAAVFTDHNGQIIPLEVSDRAACAELLEGVIAALAAFIGRTNVTANPPKSVRVDVRRTVSAPLAALHLEEAGGAVMQLQYGSRAALDAPGMVSMTIIPAALVAAVAALFDNKPVAMTDARPLLMN
jgi:hypothetical protein